MSAPRGGWRLWALQASWNREGLQDLGWRVALLPWLRQRAAEVRSEWLRRQEGPRNTNPYLAPIVLGMQVALEEEGRGALADRLVDPLSRSLGSIGDALFWTGVRPAVALSAGALALALGPWPVLPAWLLFAIFQARVRGQGLRWGYEQGAELPRRLSDPRVHRWIGRARAAALVAGGALATMLLGTVVLNVETPFAGASAAAALLLGILATRGTRGPGWAVAGLAVLVWGGLRMSELWSGSGG